MQFSFSARHQVRHGAKINLGKNLPIFHCFQGCRQRLPGSPRPASAFLCCGDPSAPRVSGRTWTFGCSPGAAGGARRCQAGGATLLTGRARRRKGDNPCGRGRKSSAGVFIFTFARAWDTGRWGRAFCRIYFCHAVKSVSWVIQRCG